MNSSRILPCSHSKSRHSPAGCSAIPAGCSAIPEAAMHALQARTPTGSRDSDLLFGVKSIFLFYFSNYYFGRLVILFFISAFHKNNTH